MQLSKFSINGGLATLAFKAMGSPCEIWGYTDTLTQAEAAFLEVVGTIERMEEKYSRYRTDSLLSQVNAAACKGHIIPIDFEFASLLSYADVCHKESGGLFDITSGALRRAWDFRSNKIPNDDLVGEVLQSVGWQHISFDDTSICFNRSGMELDFGGIVKEYAADVAGAILEKHDIFHGMVDLGGDICVVGPHLDGRPWNIKIQHPRQSQRSFATLLIRRGGLASSGDYERFIEIKGERYSHILSPITGRPVKTLAAVSVVAEKCTISGSACTIAMLKEDDGPLWLTELGASSVWMNQSSQSGQCNSTNTSSSIGHFSLHG